MHRLIGVTSIIWKYLLLSLAPLNSHDVHVTSNWDHIAELTLREIIYIFFYQIFLFTNHISKDSYMYINYSLLWTIQIITGDLKQRQTVIVRGSQQTRHEIKVLFLQISKCKYFFWPRKLGNSPSYYPFQKIYHFLSLVFHVKYLLKNPFKTIVYNDTPKINGINLQFLHYKMYITSLLEVSMCFAKNYL